MAATETTATLTTTVREMHALSADLAQHREAAARRDAELTKAIADRRRALELSADGIDMDMVEIAKGVVFIRGTYAKAGQDRAGALHDAIKQMATGTPIREHYGDLWRVAFGTKSYDAWHGQRCDCEYGYGPRHGSIIFQIGITETVRKDRKHADLTPSEIEAAVYYLTNLERIQTAEQRAATPVSA